MTTERELQELRRERDLYRMLLAAERVSDANEVLRRLVAHAVDTVGAARGYLALYATREAREKPPLVSAAHACTPTDVAQMHALVSTTVIEDTLRARRITSVPSALGHPRYALANSVRGNRITSVICAPIGADRRGVLYLQDRVAGGIFSEAHEEAIGQLAELAGPLVDRLLRELEGRAAAAPGLAGPGEPEVLGSSPAFERVRSALAARRADRRPVWLVGPRGSGKALLAGELRAGSERLTTWDGVGGARALPEAGALLVRRLEALGPDDQRAVLRGCEDRGVRLLATSRDPERVAGDVREALTGGRVDVPGWPERGDDGAALVEHLGRREAERTGRRWTGFDPGAAEALLGVLATWGPDEVARRLRIAVGHAGPGPLGLADLPPDGAIAGRRVAELFEDELHPWRDAKHAFQAAYLEHALRRHGDDPEAAAAALGMSRSRVYEALRERGLRREDG